MTESNSTRATSFAGFGDVPPIVYEGPGTLNDL